jgi:two-component system NarL family sensor kinase
VVLCVRDDGVGFDPRVLFHRLAEGHIGLAPHRARIESIGGRIDFRSFTPGTEVRVQIPARYEPIKRQET